MGHPGISQEVKGHWRPGTHTDSVYLVGTVWTSWDIPGSQGTFETWDTNGVGKIEKVGTSWDIPGSHGIFETWDTDGV